MVAARALRFPVLEKLISRHVTRCLLDGGGGAYAAAALSIEKLDGLGMEFADWRFNLAHVQYRAGSATQCGVAGR